MKKPISTRRRTTNTERFISYQRPNTTRVTRQHIGNTTYEVFNKFADADRRFTDLLEEIMARDYERTPFPAPKNAENNSEQTGDFA